MSADTPRTVQLTFHRTAKGTWLVSATWVRSFEPDPRHSQDHGKRCIVHELPDALIFDAIETSARMLKSDAFGKRNYAEELFPGSLRGD